jgi:hypothetical protein
MCIIIVYLLSINVENTPSTQQESNLMHTSIHVYIKIEQ